MQLAPQIHERIGRARIEPLRIGLRAQNRDVRNTTEIEYDAGMRCGKDARVKHRDKGRALSSGCDVTTPKIGNDVDSSEFGQSSGGV